MQAHTLTKKDYYPAHELLIVSWLITQLARAKFSGGTHGTVEGFTSSHEFVVDLSGGSRLGGDFTTSGDARFTLSGGSHLIGLDGAANDLGVSASGGGGLELRARVPQKIEKGVKKDARKQYGCGAMDLKIRRLISKYRRALLIALAYYVLLLGLVVYFTSSETYSERGPYFTPLIPSNDQYVEVALILLVYAPISALIGGLVGGYLLAPVFLFVHKNLLGSKLLYGIQDQPQPHAFKKMMRGYYPALLAVNVNSIILFSAPWILDLILNKELMELGGLVYSRIYVPGFLVLLMFTIGLGTLVFSPTWFLTDAGIVYSNKKKVAGTGQPVEGRTVGGRFTDFLRGYAGIGVVFSYLQFLSVYISEQAIPPNPTDVIVFLMFFLGLPIFLLIAVIPSLIILDIMRERRIRFLRTFAEKMGITDFVEISFEKVKGR